MDRRTLHQKFHFDYLYYTTYKNANSVSKESNVEPLNYLDYTTPFTTFKSLKGIQSWCQTSAQLNHIRFWGTQYDINPIMLGEIGTDISDTAEIAGVDDRYGWHW